VIPGEAVEYGNMMDSSRVCGGDPTRCGQSINRSIILPAYAGVILAAEMEDAMGADSSRVCGGDPNLLTL